jgi:hypothetical protein
MSELNLIASIVADITLEMIAKSMKMTASSDELNVPIAGVLTM